MPKINKKINFLMYILIFLLGFMVALSINQEKFQQDQKQQEISNINDDEILKGKANIVAVTQDQQGLLGNVKVEITEGNGKVLVNTNPFLEPDTQYSANIAAQVASNITDFDLSKKNIIYDFNITGNVLGGPSAGLAMTLATIAAINKKEVKNIGMTGTILPNGDIGLVGGVLEKGTVAAQENIKTFLVPRGQGIFTYYEKQIQKRTLNNGVTIVKTSYAPKTANLTEYFEKEYNVELIEVKNIQEAMGYAF